MKRYKIQIRYIVGYTTEVYADNEGEAYNLARKQAEEADLRQFTTIGESESQILATS